MDVVNLLSRILHIFSAIALVGGWLFLLIGLLPALRLVDGGLKDSILTLAVRSYYKVTHLASVLIVATGGWNWYLNIDKYRHPDIRGAVNGLLGTKALLGIIIVLIVFLSAFKVLPGPHSKWAKVNLALATIVVILAALVRQYRMTV